MLAIVTGLLASGLHVLAVPRNIHLLAARAIMLPARSGTTGGYWGLAQGSVVMVLGLVALLVRRLIGVQPPVDVLGFAMGVVLTILGLTAGYRLSLLEAHAHPHMHEGVEHDHIHLHAAPEQVHDHGREDFQIADVVNWPNLIWVLPALALVELDAILYLVSYLGVSTLGLGGLGSWLTGARVLGEDGSRLLRVARTIGYGLAVIGIGWVFVWWPL